MLYFSEATKKTYKTVEELELAEKQLEEEKTARQVAAEEVKAASDKVSETYDAYRKACRERDKLLTDFCKKYGSYKTTVRSEDVRTLDPLQEFLNFSFFGF